MSDTTFTPSADKLREDITNSRWHQEHGAVRVRAGGLGGPWFKVVGWTTSEFVSNPYGSTVYGGIDIEIDRAELDEIVRSLAASSLAALVKGGTP